MPSKEQWSNGLMVLSALVCVFLGFLLGRVSDSDTDMRIERAICAFTGDTVSGFVTLATRNDGRVFIYGRLDGLQGEHGMHIHDYGNLGDGCRATGSHYNPWRNGHGGRDSQEKHAGDLGNLKFVNRTASLKMETSSFSLSGTRSVVGRSLVIHQRADDLGVGGHPASRVNGASGERLACCIIAIDRQTPI